MFQWPRYCDTFSSRQHSDSNCVPDLVDVRNAPNEGKRWKLIGAGRLSEDGQAHLSVAPELLPMSDPLAGLGGALNGVSFSTDVLGDVTVVGPGAGRVETAYALLSDILDIHRKSRPPLFDPVLKEVRDA